MDSAHKAERPWLCGRGRSSLFSIYLTWLQYAANYHRDFDCFEIIQRSDDRVKSRQPGQLRTEQDALYKQKREPPSRLPLEVLRFASASTFRPCRPERHRRPEPQSPQ